MKKNDEESHNTSRAGRVVVYYRLSIDQRKEAVLALADQRRQAQEWCAARGMELVAEHIEEGLTATSDRRPERRKMIERATDDDHPYDLILVHSYSRLSRDLLECEMCIRRLAKVGIKVVFLDQELCAEPSVDLMREVISLFDEYHSKEENKHVTRTASKRSRKVLRSRRPQEVQNDQSKKSKMQ